MNTTNVNLILSDILDGKPILVVDEHDREDEGDLVIAACMADKHNLAFMMLHARGLMCVPCSGPILDRLQIPLMVTKTTDPLETPFTVSVDAMTTTTGMSVFDRMKTLKVFLDPNSVPEDFKRPGHLFPLRAKPGLMKERRGHTETSIELMKLAGLPEVAVIVEVMNADGTMTKGQQLVDFAKMYNIKTVTVKEVYEAVYHESL